MAVEYLGPLEEEPEEGIEYLGPLEKELDIAKAYPIVTWAREESERQESKRTHTDRYSGNS